MNTIFVQVHRMVHKISQEKLEDKNRSPRISRGYRLKLSTHRLIKSLQEITQTDADSVLTESCILYYKEILKRDENIKLNLSKQRKAS